MDNELQAILKNFENQGTLLVEGKRNKIKIFAYNGKEVAIKSFRIPIFINGIIYKFFRPSKAKRSFDYAKILTQKGIGTPEPIAYYEHSNFYRILDSYYVCEHIQADYVFKDLFHQELSKIEFILKQFAHFCFAMHENGIEFLDHSPGNTLIKIDENQNCQFYLIDLNRMKFHQKIDFDLRMKNLSKITPSKEMVQLISKEYAKLYQKNENEVFEKMWYYTSKFQKKFLRKKKLKNFKI
ncbi:lipopolysaccharide kinase InaA family protein [Flavobacterium sp. 20NA77.7]|uniref:Lipopolysaccharide kinase InaA family protein n=1 Tax=Flavobacterium nakdongensis TaxID=3073563 RepID=A0ABY9RBF9_9FLAO|nr:lipopolysaccharide kinase InaA family protein [Flavobacterium sp. 20NA77.7]WMW78572.1 lipopolysaccharide kinase InaA family protein [Flavobacterium sp. 20NA77.7]